MAVTMQTWSGQLNTPQDDALVYEVAVGDSGIIYGAEVTIKNSNTLHIAGGHGVICGRKITIEEQDISVVLPNTAQNGRLYLHMDLSNTTSPIELITEIAAALTPEEQDENVNITLGVYDINLVTFSASPTEISALVNVAPIVPKNITRTIEVAIPASSWTGSAAPYQNTVTDARITDQSNPELYSKVAGLTEAQQKDYIKAFTIVSQGYAITSDGSVTFYAYKKPETSITVYLKGV